MRRGDPAIAVAWRAAWRSWRVRGWAIALAAIGLGLMQVPLVGVLGYEHAFVVGVVMSIAGLDLGAAFARRARRVPASALARAVAPGRLVAAIAWRAAAIAAAVAAIPAGLAAARGAWTPVCDWGFAVRAELLLPIATAVIASLAGAAAGLSIARPARCAAALVALWLVVAATAIWRFYVEPPVFWYDAILGYFPGNLYDETVTLGWPLVFSRLEQLAAALAMLAAASAWLDAPTLHLRGGGSRRPSGFRTLELGATVLLAAAALALWWQGGALGFAVDASDLDAELDGVKITPHFVIHYPRRPDLEADIDLIAADHEFRYAQVARTLGVDVDGRIDSYYFADADQKARLMGARNVEMAKPWERAIFVQHEAFPHPVIRHEIAHVVAGEFGDSWFHLGASRVLGVHVPNPGLVEGLAVATDWPGSYAVRETPDEDARILSLNGIEPSLGTLFSLGFVSQAAGRAYYTAGSFMHFLLVRYGAPSLRALYHSGGDFEGTYGKPRTALEGEWRQMIDAITPSKESIERGRERFRGGGVFQTPCLHAVAARNAEAGQREAEGDRAGAIAIVREVCAQDPDEPYHRMYLADLLDGTDATPHERAEAKAIRGAIAGDTERTTAPVRSDALRDLGLRAARDGDWKTADDDFTRALALPNDLGDERLLEARLYALHHTGPAGGALRGYFFAPDAAEGSAPMWAGLIVAAEPGLGLGWYLRGLQHVVHREWAGAAADLAHALDLGLPGPRFTSAAARALAIAAWRAGDHARVAKAADVLAAGGNEIERLLADDWRQRIEFAESGRLAPITR